jgi:hypothetical protein
MPVEVTLPPPATLQFTAVLSVPVTSAENCCWRLVNRDAWGGVTLTLTTSTVKVPDAVEVPSLHRS